MAQSPQVGVITLRDCPTSQQHVNSCAQIVETADRTDSTSVSDAFRRRSNGVCFSRRSRGTPHIRNQKYLTVNRSPPCASNATANSKNNVQAGTIWFIFSTNPPIRSYQQEPNWKFVSWERTPKTDCEGQRYDTSSNTCTNPTCKIFSPIEPNCKLPTQHPLRGPVDP